MFCADYVAAFVHHSLLTYCLADKEKWKEKPVFPAVVGGLSGALAAASVYPFDFVRRGLTSTTSFKARLRGFLGVSTVAYSTLFFGLYFSCRSQSSTPSQLGWALTSAALAAAAEVPLDAAKLAAFGGDRRAMIMAAALYVPFGALMLVMYDKALIKWDSQRIA